LKTLITPPISNECAPHYVYVTYVTYT